MKHGDDLKYRIATSMIWLRLIPFLCCGLACACCMMCCSFACCMAMCCGKKKDGENMGGMNGMGGMGMMKDMDWMNEVPGIREGNMIR